MRLGFAAAYLDAGSFLDSDRDFKSVNDLLTYIPRATEIGLWAPFPKSGISAGRRVGNAGKLLAGAETFFIYLCQVLANDGSAGATEWLHNASAELTRSTRHLAKKRSGSRGMRVRIRAAAAAPTSRHL